MPAEIVKQRKLLMRISRPTGRKQLCSSLTQAEPAVTATLARSRAEARAGHVFTDSRVSAHDSHPGTWTISFPLLLEIPPYDE
ncbi:hypothetical protein GCM10023078_46280 [Gibbsiella greigii]